MAKKVEEKIKEMWSRWWKNGGRESGEKDSGEGGRKVEEKVRRRWNRR